MKFVVFCEKAPGPGLELIGKARAIAPDAWMVALSECTDGRLLLAGGANEVQLIDVCPDDCAQGSRIAVALQELNADAVLFPATVRGRFLSAWTAAKLDTGLTADCTELSIQDGLLLQTRPAFGNNLTADILCKERRPQMASVRPGVFPQPVPVVEPVGKCETMILPSLLERMRRLSFEPVESGVSLQSAKVVIAGGKGVGSRQGFQKLFELADLLGGAVGATRSAVDAGYIAYEHQIGQTGVTIRPELYIGFGISGLVQHTVGMSSAKTVVSVNRERSAPIFACSDFGIIADWQDTIDMMIQYIKERKH